MIVALVTGAVLAFAPVMATSSCEATAGGPMRCSSGQTSLLDHEGAGILGVLAIPAVVAAVPVLFPSRRSRLGAALALTAAALVGMASIGLFLLPAVVLMWVAVADRHGGTRLEVNR